MALPAAATKPGPPTWPCFSASNTEEQHYIRPCPEQIFEISARQALAAASFLRELTDRPNDLPLPLAEMPTAQQLARQTLGLRWQERLHSISTKELAQEAEYLWKLSGFPAFLDRAMQKLIMESPHRCLRTALQTGQNCLRDWRERAG